jgi:ATP synthase protein I
MPLARGKTPDKSGSVGDTPDAGKMLSSEELESRSRSLEAKLAAKGVTLDGEPEDKGTETASGVAQAMKLSSEFIAGVLAGAGLGWLADRFLGTSPWGLIVLLLLGFCAGTLNILRSAGHVAENPGLELRKRSDHEKPE